MLNLSGSGFYLLSGSGVYLLDGRLRSSAPSPAEPRGANPLLNPAISPNFADREEGCRPASGKFLQKHNRIMKKLIATPEAPAAVGPYSQAVEAGGTLYISGQLPIDPETKTMPDGVREQTLQSLKNIAAILKAAGYTKNDVVKSTVLLADIADFAAMNEVYAGFYTENPPARVAFQVAALPMGARVEIETIAVRG